jgi:hypothetical protein
MKKPTSRVRLAVWLWFLLCVASFLILVLWRNNRLRSIAAELKDDGITLTWSDSSFAQLWPTPEKAAFNYTVGEDSVQIGSKLYKLPKDDDAMNKVIADNCDRLR